MPAAYRSGRCNPLLCSPGSLNLKLDLFITHARTCTWSKLLQQLADIQPGAGPGIPGAPADRTHCQNNQTRVLLPLAHVLLCHSVARARLYVIVEDPFINGSCIYTRSTMEKNPENSIFQFNLDICVISASCSFTYTRHTCVIRSACTRTCKLVIT